MTVERTGSGRDTRRLGWSVGAYFLLGLAPYVIPTRSGLEFGSVYPIGFLVFGPMFVWLLLAGLGGVAVDLVRHRRLVANPRLAGACIAMAAGGLAVIVHRTMYLGLPPGSNVSPFDGRAWRTTDAERLGSEKLTPRQRMLKAAIQRLPGTHREQVEHDLGPSLDTPYFRTTGRDLIYYLGPGRSFLSLDSEWLLVWLTPDAKVARFALVED